MQIDINPIIFFKLNPICKKYKRHHYISYSDYNERMTNLELIDN